jgi:hypothetical protein
VRLEGVGPTLFFCQRRAPLRSVSHGRCGHKLRAAAELFVLVVGALVEAAVEELKVGVGLGVGQLPRTTYASGPTCSIPAKGIRPNETLAIAASAKLNWNRPSTGTDILIVLSLSPASKKEGESRLGR